MKTDFQSQIQITKIIEIKNVIIEVQRARDLEFLSEISFSCCGDITV